MASAVAGFRLFADQVTSHLPATRRILYLAIHRSPSDVPLWGFIERANGEIRRVCRAYGMVEFVDYLHLLIGPDGELREKAFMPDGLHFTPAFYRQLSVLLRPFLDGGWSRPRGLSDTGTECLPARPQWPADLTPAPIRFTGRNEVWYTLVPRLQHVVRGSRGRATAGNSSRQEKRHDEDSVLGAD